MCSGMTFKTAYLSFLLAVLLLQPAIAGSGFYYGFDAVFHALDTSTEVRVTYTPPILPPTLIRGDRSQSFSDVGFHIGYLFKHRRTQNYFIAPEFFIATLDSSDSIYGTNFKFGTDFNRLRVFANLGVSRIDAFKQNKLQLGVGAEYALNDYQSIGLEWLRIDTIEENSSADSTTFITETHTGRDIDAIKVSFRIYLLE